MHDEDNARPELGENVTQSATIEPAPAPRSAAQIGVGRVLVVVPTYNEADNIRLITGKLYSALSDVDLLIADDNSPDGTGKIADELAAANPRIQVLHRPGKQGLGAAYIAGFHWAIERGYDVVVEMDADGSHPPERLPALLEKLAAPTNADVAIGSRWVPGGKVVNWPKRREVLSRGASVYARLMLGVPVRDVTAGYRAYRREVLEKLDLASVVSQGYCFQVDLTRRTNKLGFRFAEVPITFADREHGQSKMNSGIVVEAFRRVAAWGVRDRLSQIRAVFRKS